MSQLFQELKRRNVFRVAIAYRGVANNIAAEADSRPYGYLFLMQIPVNCACGAPFELDVTPNFAKLLEDAELSWPPVSPIEWPLKDW